MEQKIQLRVIVGGVRNGRSSPLATDSGMTKEYFPIILMCL